GADLEAGLLEGGVGVGRAGQVAELDLEAGGGGVDGHRKGHLEELVVLVPVDVGHEVDTAGSGGQRHRLVDDRVAERAPEAHRAPQPAGFDTASFDDGDLDRAGQVGDLVEVVAVDVPRIPVAGPVLVE